jgi:hypothetical protein
MWIVARVANGSSLVRHPKDVLGMFQNLPNILNMSVQVEILVRNGTFQFGLNDEGNTLKWYDCIHYNENNEQWQGWQHGLMRLTMGWSKQHDDDKVIGYDGNNIKWWEQWWDNWNGDSKWW